MARDLPEFLTVRQASKRAMRNECTIRRWIACGFLKIVEGGYFPGERKPHIILGSDLDHAIAIAEGYAPNTDRDPRTPAYVSAIAKRTHAQWLANRSPARKAADAAWHREYVKKWRKRKKRLRAQCLNAPSDGPKPAGRSSPAAATKSRSSASGKNKRRRTPRRSASGGSTGRTRSPPPSPASSAASHST